MIRTDRFWDLVEQRAAQTPDRVLFADEDGRTMTFGAYRDAALAVAAGLRSLGIGVGPERRDEVIAWQLPTSIEAAVMMAAASRLDLTQAPVIPLLREREVGHIVGQLADKVGPVTLVVPGVLRGFDHVAMAESISVNSGCMVLVADESHWPAHTNPWALNLPTGDPAMLPEPPDHRPGTVRWIYSTSGTTSVPKLARHTDATALATTVHFEEGIGFVPDDVTVLASPIAHVGGVLTLGSALMIGFEMTLVRHFDPIATPQLCSERDMSVLRGAAPVARAFIEAQLAMPDRRLFPRLRACQGGGSARPIDVHEGMKSVFGISGATASYGMTECPGITACRPTDSEDHIAGTSGRIVRGCSILVIGPDGSLLEPGEEGELLVSGPMQFLGYVDSSLDAAAFDERTFDGRHYVRSGDLGIVDAEGWVQVTGRIKDVIIRNGENISAQLVEDVLSLHPDIRDAAVIAVPDARTGERACAVVALREGVAQLTLTDVIRHCEESGLARQRFPEQLEIVDEVPRNAIGKIEKQALRDRYAKR
ncbi:MAG: class I adenylate-forming enzyme family protein [Acidimicrobiia bacterium]